METPAEIDVVTVDTTLAGETSGELKVSDGASLTISGSHKGSVELEGDGELIVVGTLDGHLEIGSLSTARILGTVTGSVLVRVAGTLLNEATGKVIGPVTNYGSFINHGRRSGHVDGRDPDDRPEPR